MVHKLMALTFDAGISGAIGFKIINKNSLAKAS